MVANFLDYFYKDDFDKKIIIKHQKKDYTVKEIKSLVLTKINNLKETNLSNLDCFDFILEFLARLFVEKTILLNEPNTPKDISLNQFPQIDITKTNVIFKTSGSSNTPKTVEKTIENLFQESYDLIYEFPQINTTEGLEFISTTTPHHLFGFTFHFMLALNSGSIINTDEVSIPENINLQNSCLITTPSFLEKMNKYNNTPIINPQLIISAGSPLKKEVFEFAQSISNTVIEIYGSTETGVIAHRESPNNNFKPFRSISVNPNENSTTIETKYSATSPITINDKITVKNGLIKIEGRTDRVFKIQEKRINANEVETTIKKHEFIEDCYLTEQNDKLACLSVLNKDGVDYFYKNGIVNLIKELKQYSRQCYDIIPQKWKFIDEIPKTKQGKIDKQEVENIFGLNLSMPLIVNREVLENKVKIKLYFYRNCNFFKGHFEKFPIVPGVVQLYFAKYFAKKFLDYNCENGQYKRLKFSNIIKPEKIIDLELELLSNGISYTYTDKEKKYSSGVLPLKEFTKV